MPETPEKTLDKEFGRFQQDFPAAFSSASHGFDTLLAKNQLSEMLRGSPADCHGIRMVRTRLRTKELAAGFIADMLNQAILSAREIADPTGHPGSSPENSVKIRHEQNMGTHVVKNGKTIFFASVPFPVTGGNVSVTTLSAI